MHFPSGWISPLHLIINFELSPNCLAFCLHFTNYELQLLISCYAYLYNIQLSQYVVSTMAEEPFWFSLLSSVQCIRQYLEQAGTK